MSENKKTPRNKKTSNEQLDILLNFITENKVLIDGKTHLLKPSETKNLKDDLTKKICENRGAVKSGDEWKRFLQVWKCKTKAKARKLKLEQTGTGGGASTSPPLTDYEERLMALVGWNTVEGCNEVAEELIPEKPDSPPLYASQLEEIILKNDDNTQFVELCNTVIEESFEKLPVLEKQTPIKTKITRPKFKTSRPTNKTSTNTSKLSTLENAAKVYSDISENFTKSAALNAGSVEKLVRAISMYATALLGMVEVEKEKLKSK